MSIAAGPTVERRTRIILVRHGHVEGMAPPRFRGRADLPLTEMGRRQAEITGNWLGRCMPPDTIYASPLLRCIQTAEAIARNSQVSIVSLETFTDMDYGEWQGKTYNEVQAADPLGYARWRQVPHEAIIPNGEGLHDVAARVALTGSIIFDRHDGHTVVLVGHDSVNRILLLLALGLPLSQFWRIRQDPCGISLLDYEAANGWTIQSVNETLHLKTDSSSIA